MANSIDALVKLSDEGKDVTSKGISGIYDIDQLTKTQKEQAAHAIRYIYQMLPDNAKTLLQAKLGSETDATNYVLQVITDKVQSTASDTNEHKETMLTDLKGKNQVELELADLKKQSHIRICFRILSKEKAVQMLNSQCKIKTVIRIQ